MLKLGLGLGDRGRGLGLGLELGLGLRLGLGLGGFGLDYNTAVYGKVILLMHCARGIQSSYWSSIKPCRSVLLLLNVACALAKVYVHEQSPPLNM